MKLPWLKILLFIGLWFGQTVYAASVEITFDPVRPVVNEPFNIIFTITTSQNDNKEPYINFELSRGEVKSKVLASRSSNATVINGRFQLTKSYRYEYEVMTDRSGVLMVRNIEVDMDGNIVKPSNKTVKIYSKRQTPTSFFLQAEVSQESAFVGEGIDLRYYLYSRIPVSPLEIEIFPKLKGFIKRFHMPDNRTETVEIDGVIYRRSVQYSARIYPEKIGDLRIDPLKLKVQYSDRRNKNFGQFGFAFGKRRNKSLRSKPIIVKVDPVPAENVPKTFTGLIGYHEFKFSINKSKFLVNEVIEMKLVVDGPGALEKLDIPQLISHPEIENFDIKSELNEVSKSRSTKTFEFTYLPRDEVELPEKTVQLHYYDRKTGSFKYGEIKIPAISVKGGAVQSKSSTNTGSANAVTETPFEDNNKGSSLFPKLTHHRKFVTPAFNENDESELINFPRLLIILFAIIILVQIGWMLRGVKLFRKYPLEVSRAYAKVRSEGVSFTTLSSFIRSITGLTRGDSIHLPLSEQIQHLEISDAAKNYLTQCVVESANIKYARNRNKNKLKLESKYFKEALKLVEIS